MHTNNEKTKVHTTHTVHLDEWQQHREVVVKCKHRDDRIPTRSGERYGVETVKNGQLLGIVNVLLNGICFNKSITMTFQCCLVYQGQVFSLCSV